MLNPRLPKATIRDHLLALAHEQGHELSRSRACRLADRYKQGQYDRDLAALVTLPSNLTYADPTGETVARHHTNPQRTTP